MSKKYLRLVIIFILLFIESFLFAELQVQLDVAEVAEVQIQRGAARVARVNSNASSDMIVHEWGSIHHIQGSGEYELLGLSEDQSDLPPFVYVLSEKPVRPVPMIMEKPILYFYTKKAMSINVNVSCPSGLLTQWWPNVSSYSPSQFNNKKLKDLKNGSLNWRRVYVDPNLKPKYQKGPKGSWWDKVRDVDATPLNIRGESEKFLFYRGVAKVNPSVKISFTDNGLAIENAGDKDVGKLFLSYIKKGQGVHTQIDKIEKKSTFKTNTKDNSFTELKKSSDEMQKALQKYLESLGLYAKEANGMSTIWQKSYFETEGVHLIFALDKKEIDSLLPLNIHPKPKETVRVLLVHLEALLQDSEKDILALVEKLGSSNFRERRKISKELKAMSKSIVPVLNKAMTKYGNDPEIKITLKEIIKSFSFTKPE